MRIVIGKTQALTKEPTTKRSSDYNNQKGFKKERRKNKKDRRKSVRDGVIVKLSIKNDRRSGRDRRKSG